MRHNFYSSPLLVLMLAASLLTSIIFTAKTFANTDSSDSFAIVELEPPRAGSHLESFSFRSMNNDLVRWDQSAKTLKTNDSAHNYSALVIHVFQPDCGKCNSLATPLQELRAQYSSNDVFIIGIAHRKDIAASKAFAEKHSLTYPILNATDTEWGMHWGRGDAFYIIDSTGLVVFSQTGFNSSDPESWGYIIGDLIGSRRNLITEAKRKRLHISDTLPSIVLPSLADRSPMSLSVENSKLSFVNAGVKRQNYRASIGFFSRF